MVQHNWSDGHLLTPKSGRSREVPLPSASLVSLQAWRKQSTSRLVFPSQTGGYLKDATLYAWLDKATESVGLRHIGWHMLRHTYASHLVQPPLSTPLPIVQKLLGHASITMTQRYSHLAPSNLHDAAQGLDRIVAAG